MTETNLCSLPQCSVKLICTYKIHTDCDLLVPNINLYEYYYKLQSYMFTANVPSKSYDHKKIHPMHEAS